MRESARALRMILIERWGQRLGSLGREWTRFERMAQQYGQEPLAARIAAVAGADTATALQRGSLAPIWLQERIELCYGSNCGRREGQHGGKRSRPDRCLQRTCFTAPTRSDRPLDRHPGPQSERSFE